MTLRRHFWMIDGSVVLLFIGTFLLSVTGEKGTELVSHGEVICNYNTTYACPCSTCWTDPTVIRERPSNATTETDQPLKWVAIELQQCPHFTSKLEQELRQKMAQWITEECSFVLDCRKFASHLNGVGFTEANVVLCGLECSEIEFRGKKNKARATLYMNMLINALGEFTQKNLVPAERLGSVIQAREHLLSMLLSADLEAVSLIERTFTSDSELNTSNDEDSSIFHPRYFRYYNIFAVSAMLISFFATLCLACSCAFCYVSRVNWSRFSSPMWYHGTSEPKVAYIRASRYDSESRRTIDRGGRELCFLSACNDGATSTDSSFNTHHEIESQSLSPISN